MSTHLWSAYPSVYGYWAMPAPFFINWCDTIQWHAYSCAMLHAGLRGVVAPDACSCILLMPECLFPVTTIAFINMQVQARVWHQAAAAVPPPVRIHPAQAVCAHQQPDVSSVGFWLWQQMGTSQYACTYRGCTSNLM